MKVLVGTMNEKVTIYILHVGEMYQSNGNITREHISKMVYLINVFQLLDEYLVSNFSCRIKTTYLPLLRDHRPASPPFQDHVSDYG